MVLRGWVDTAIVNDRRSTRWLLTGGVIGPVLFVVVLLVEGWTRADYDPMTMFGSLLSLGDLGWQQVANFVVSGLLVLGGALGLRRVLTDGPGCRWGPRLIGLAGIGLVLAGVFVTDPAQGYPPGAPSGMPASSSWHGSIHLVASAFVFIGLPVAMVVMARRFRGEGSRWALYCWLSAVGVLAFLFASQAFTSVAGLLQRVLIVLVLGWVAQITWRFRREAAA
jgi:hypothetical membrane protein